MSNEETFNVLVLYHNPTDYPNKYVLRWHRGETPDKEPVCVVNLYKEVLPYIPNGLVKLLPSVDDDDCILETWI